MVETVGEEYVVRDLFDSFASIFATKFIFISMLSKVSTVINRTYVDVHVLGHALHGT